MIHNLVKTSDCNFPLSPDATHRVIPDQPRNLSSYSNDFSEPSCEHIHNVLRKLPLFRAPGKVPFKNGIYFFYEDGEYSVHAKDGRIVRIGNHPRSDNSLIRRLRAHYSGRKNGSVFRKFIGGALLRSSNPDCDCLLPGPGKGHWEVQDAKVCAACAPIELQVSAVLREKFAFRAVEITNRAERNQFENLLIATLAACENCCPSDDWLGRYTYSPVVRASGMWNVQSVGGDTLTGDDMLRFDQLVDETERTWHSNENC